MIEIQYWPNEFLVHYYRLDENVRQFILTKVKENYQSKLDPLLNFTNTVISLLEGEGSYYYNSEFLFLSAVVLQLLGKFERILEVATLDEFHPGLLNAKVFSLISQRKFNTVLESIEIAKNNSKGLDPYNYFLSLAYEIFYYYNTQNIDSCKLKISELDSEYNKIMTKFQNSNSIETNFLIEPFVLGKSVNISLLRKEGNLDEANQFGRDLISKIRPTKNRYILNRLLNNTAISLIECGNIKEGLQYLEEHFAFSQLIANELQLAIGANNLGFIHRTMGNLENAMKYFFIALENAKKAKAIPYIVAAETNIAHLHLDFGNPSLALSNSEQALQTMNKSEVPIPPNIRIPLDFCRIDIFEALDKYNEAEEILTHAQAEIQKYELTSELPKVYLRQARLAVRQSNLGEAVKALEKAHEIALESNLFEIIINARLQLAEIDLLRYRMTNDANLLSSALIKIDDVKQLCFEQDFKLILIDILILQGLLFYLKNRQKEGRKALDEAIELSKKLNIKDKEREATNQLSELEKESKNLLSRIFTRINESIRSTISFQNVSKPKKVIVELYSFYIISKQSGLPIYQKDFDVSKSIDTTLLSGLISAIRTMGQTILDSKEEGLKLIDHGDVAIMLETGEEFFYALIVTRETFLLREKLRAIKDKISTIEGLSKIDQSVIILEQSLIEKIESQISEVFT